MEKEKAKGYWTKSLKAAAYLRVYAGMLPTKTSNRISKWNPDGKTEFFYEDGEKAREVMLSYETHDEFHMIFDAYFNAKKLAYEMRRTENAHQEDAASATVPTMAAEGVSA